MRQRAEVIAYWIACAATLSSLLYATVPEP